MKKVIVFLILGALLSVPLAAYALDFQKNPASVSLKTTRGNAYMAGANISVLEPTDHDLFAAGANVNISSDIGEDLAAAGGQVSVLSKVGGDVRVAGGNILINSSTGGELLATGGQIEVSSNSVVGGDAIVAGGMVNINGTVNGDARVAGGNIYINGTVNGNVNVEADSELILGSQAKISGNLTYSAPKEAEVKQGAVVTGKTDFNKISRVTGAQTKAGSKAAFLGLLSFFAIAKFLATLTAVLVLYFLLKDKINAFIMHSVKNFGRELVRGFVLAVVFPVLAVVLFVTLIGFALAALLLGIYGVFMAVSALLSSLLLAGLINKWRGLNKLTWPVIILSVVIMSIIGWIPFVGWIAGFVFVLVVFGALMNSFYKIMRSDSAI